MPKGKCGKPTKAGTNGCSMNMMMRSTQSLQWKFQNTSIPAWFPPMCTPISFPCASRENYSRFVWMTKCLWSNPRYNAHKRRVKRLYRLIDDQNEESVGQWVLETPSGWIIEVMLKFLILDSKRKKRKKHAKLAWDLLPTVGRRRRLSDYQMQMNQKKLKKPMIPPRLTIFQIWNDFYLFWIY